MSDREKKKQAMTDALKQVMDPATGADIVSAGHVRDVTHCDGAAKATLAMTASPPVVEAVRRQAQQVLERLDWVTEVTIKVDAPQSAAAGAPAAAPASDGMDVRFIVAVASGKGGVGKSTIAANLACGLARSGASVGLLDADVYGPSIPMMLGATGRPEIVEKGGRKLLKPHESHGVKLMSMGFLVEDDKPVIWRGPMLHGALKQFFNDVDWGALDYLIVDLPPGTGDVALTMVQTISLAGAVIVSTPQSVAMLDAKKALAMFGQTGVPILGIVENMSGEIFGAGTCEKWAAEQKVGYLGSVPLDADVRKSGDAGKPAVLGGNESVGAPLMQMVDSVKSALGEQGSERKTISIHR